MVLSDLTPERNLWRFSNEGSDVGESGPEIWLCEMLIELLSSSPILMKHKMGGLFLALVEVVIDASGISATWLDQGQQSLTELGFFSRLCLYFGNNRYGYGVHISEHLLFVQSWQS